MSHGFESLLLYLLVGDVEPIASLLWGPFLFCTVGSPMLTTLQVVGLSPKTMAEDHLVHSRHHKC